MYVLIHTGEGVDVFLRRTGIIQLFTLTHPEPFGIRLVISLGRTRLFMNHLLSTLMVYNRTAIAGITLSTKCKRLPSPHPPPVYNVLANSKSVSILS